MATREGAPIPAGVSPAGGGEREDNPEARIARVLDQLNEVYQLTGAAPAIAVGELNVDRLESTAQRYAEVLKRPNELNALADQREAFLRHCAGQGTWVRPYSPDVPSRTLTLQERWDRLGAAQAEIEQLSPELPNADAQQEIAAIYNRHGIDHDETAIELAGLASAASRFPNLFHPDPKKGGRTLTPPEQLKDLTHEVAGADDTQVLPGRAGDSVNLTADDSTQPRSDGSTEALGRSTGTAEDPTVVDPNAPKRRHESPTRHE